MRHFRCASRQWYSSSARHAATASSSSDSLATCSQVSFLHFSKSARDDVATILRDQNTTSLVDRVDEFSTLALDLWPKEAPHWRFAEQLVVPPILPDVKTLSTELAIDGKKQEGSGLPPLSRSRSLQALCAANGSGSSSRRTASFLAALVDSGGVVGGSGGLAYQLPLDELCRCVDAIAFRHGERWMKHSQLGAQDKALKGFVQDAVLKLLAVPKKLSLQELHGLWLSLKRCGVDAAGVEQELRKRIRVLADDANPTEEISSSIDIPCAVACARDLGETAVLKGSILRQALLPASLQASTAAKLLQYAIPLEGGLSTGHTYMVAMAVGQIVSGARQLSVGELSSAVHGVLALQAQGDDFAIQSAARVLRALWPRVCLRLPHFPPSSLGATLKAYWWQLLYSRQELALTGSSRDHPLVEFIPEPLDSRKRNRSLEKSHDSVEELTSKLLHPTFARLGEMPLKSVGTCLTAIAPSVRPPDVLTELDRNMIRDAVTVAFPLGSTSVEKSSTLEWWDEFWTSELQQLTTSELLEMACSLRELQGIGEAEAGNWWLLESLLQELTRRLSSSGRDRPNVELSHFLLLRMCRVMDVWQGHEVEGILRHLLSDPAAMTPLPTPYLTALIGALCKWSVPKEIPMRLLSSFLDRVDKGDRVVDSESWSDILGAVQTLNEPTSGERITTRIIQHLVPHLPSMPAPMLASSLSALAARPLPSEVRGSNRERVGYSALERAPVVATQAVSALVGSGQWDFHELVSVFESLGRLGWYSDDCVRAVLAQSLQTPLLESHAPLLLPLVRTCVALRVHHAPLIHKMALWYGWCYAYLREKPLPSSQLDELIELADLLCELSFQSLEMLSILAENLRNPNASPRQLLGLLSALARFAHFPPEFKDACSKVGAESTDSDLVSLSSADLTNAFNIHLCGVFDGPAALKHWLTEDEAMKQFFQVHTSQKWYQKQDQERTTFLQSETYLTLVQAAQDEGLDLRPSSSGEVYHVELVAKDAKERLASWSNDPPMALVCIKSKDQLRWYVPVTAEGEALGDQFQNRCERFRFMFRGTVQKVRHLQAMGYRPVVIWMSEWNALSSQEERAAYLRAACSSHDQQSTAFSPGSEEDAYE